MAQEQSARRAVAVTSFDFLNGAYKRSATRRLVVLSFFGVFLIAAMAVFLYGLNNLMMASSAAQEKEAAFQSQLEKSRELTSLSSSQGLGEQEMVSHISERASKILSILQATPPVHDLFSDVQATLPQGITLTGISVESAAPVSGDSSSDKKDTPAPSKSVISVTLSGYAPSISAIESWNRSLDTISYMTFEDATWTDATERGIPVTIPGTFNADATSPRYLYYSGLLNVSADPNDPTAASSPSSSPSSTSTPEGQKP